MENSKFDIDINVYPNPASDKLFIDCKNECLDMYFELYDIEGQRKVHQELERKSLNTIYLKEINNGLYLFKISNKNNIVISKIIIKK